MKYTFLREPLCPRVLVAFLIIATKTPGLKETQSSIILNTCILPVFECGNLAIKITLVRIDIYLIITLLPYCCINQPIFRTETISLPHNLLILHHFFHGSWAVMTYVKKNSLEVTI
jgi:hypothetical protein